MNFKYLIILFAIIAMQGCTDPYSHRITGKITPSQAEKLAVSLPDKDRDLFLRWHKRDTAGERFGGERGVNNVKDAIDTQVEFEVLQARQYEQQKQQRAEAEKTERSRLAALEAEKQRIASIGDHRRRVHDFISNAISSKALSYRLETQLDNYNRPIGKQWAFNIEVKNKTDKEVIGLVGYLSLKDAFGNNLGAYPFRFETNLLPGKVSTQTLWMQDDPYDKNLQNLKAVQSIVQEWFLESLAFRDGSRIDANSVPISDNLPARKTS